MVRVVPLRIASLVLRYNKFFLNKKTMSVISNGLENPLKAPSGPQTKMTVVLGAQWGDEGKGKLVDILATKADLVCRCQVSSPCKVESTASVLLNYVTFFCNRCDFRKEN